MAGSVGKGQQRLVRRHLKIGGRRGDHDFLLRTNAVVRTEAAVRTGFGFELTVRDPGGDVDHFALRASKVGFRTIGLDCRSIPEIDENQRHRLHLVVLRGQRIDGELQTFYSVLVRLRRAGFVVDDPDLMAVHALQPVESALHPGSTDDDGKLLLVLDNLSRGLRQRRTQEPRELIAAVLLIAEPLLVLGDDRLAKLVEEAGDDGCFVRRPPGLHSIEISLEGLMHGVAIL